MEIETKFVQFETTDSLLLEGLLNESDNKSLAIIHIHAMEGFFWHPAALNILTKCQEENIGCMIFNNRGRGSVTKVKSTIDKQYDIMAGTSYEIFEDSLKDIEGAINYLLSKGYEKFILSGHSTGSQKALYFALNAISKYNEKIIGYIFLAPGDDLNLLRNGEIENFEDIFKQTRQTYESKTIFAIPQIGSFSSKRFYDLVKEGSIEGNLFNYKTDLSHIYKVKQPILAIFGEEEQHALIPPREMLDKIQKQFANSKSQTILSPGNHSFKSYEQELTDVIIEWVKNIQ